MYITLWSRFMGYALIGGLLILVYQFVFMARTSANRDWNHLHGNYLSSVQAKRLLIQRTSVQPNVTSESGLSSKFKSLKMNIPESIVVSASYNDNPLELSNYSNIFSLDRWEPGIHTIELEKVHIVYHDSDTDLSSVIRTAESSGSLALLLVVPPSWVPNRGLSKFKLPIIATVSDIPALRNGHRSNLEIELADISASQISGYEWHLNGHLSDTVVVGDSQSDPLSSAVFWGIANAYYELSTQYNWKPLRSVRFVSYPHFSAEMYTRKHRSWINRKVIGYISAGAPVDSVTASLPMHYCVENALQQFRDAAILSNDEQVENIQLGLGENVWPLEFMIPSVSANLRNSETTAKLLILVLATLSQEPFLPFDPVSFAHFVPFEYFSDMAYGFRKRIKQYKLSFTQEFPWYQWISKIKALAYRKKANLSLRNLEQCCKLKKETEYHKHMLFTSDSSWSKTEPRPLLQDDLRSLTECILKNILD